MMNKLTVIREVTTKWQTFRGSTPRTVADGAAAGMHPHTILQEVRSTGNQQTPFGAAGDKCSCCVVGRSDQASHSLPVCWVEQRGEQSFLIPITMENLISM